MDDSSTKDSFGCWDGFDVMFDKAFAPATTPPHETPTPSEPADRQFASPSRPLNPDSSEDSMGPPTPIDRDYQSLGLLWDALRDKKARQMAKEAPKVKSLEEGIHDLDLAHHPRRPHSPNHMPGIKKSQVHISYRGHYLIVDWETVNITEHEEGGKIVRDRKEKKYSRTLPIPDGTRFEEVRASMDGRHLILTYPNMRPMRVEPRRFDSS